MSRTPELEHPYQVIERALTAIDIYWDAILEYPKNTLQVTSKEPEEGTGRTLQDIFTVKRFYETAYYIKCEKSALYSWGGNSPIMNEPVETIELRFTPALLELGKVTVTHIDPSGLSSQGDILIDNLKKDDEVAAETLKSLQVNLLAMLVGHCKEVDPFTGAETIRKVREAIEDAFGPKLAEEMWNAGIYGIEPEE